MPDKQVDRVEIHVRPNGSLKVYGPIRVLDVDGQAYDLAPWRTQDGHGERIKLCRCGRSKTQPFCDESHTRVGFVSEPRVTDEISADEAGDSSGESNDPD